MLVKKLIASALCLAAISSASAFSLGGDSEGQRFLLLMIDNTDQRISSVSEVRSALQYGGSINLNDETARKVDPNFDSNLTGQVFCDAQLKAKDFNPDKVKPQCYLTKPALLNWVGKHGWSLSETMLGRVFIMSKPWSKYK